MKRDQYREKNPKWRGGKRINARGYALVLRPEHPRANCDNYVPEHILIAEKAIGEYLPKGAEIHHLNYNKSDNRSENLVVCPDHAYHALLHIRQDALDACGHSTWRKCSYCKKYDNPKNLSIYEYKERTVVRHNHCFNLHRRKQG